MSIQSDLTFTDIALHQAELRREATEARRGRRVRTRRGLIERLTHRRDHRRQDTSSSGTTV